jgi:hypothetical protein
MTRTSNPFGNEADRLFQGISDIPGTNTCLFVELKNIQKGIKITYGKIVCDYKPHKKEKERVRLTVDGKILDYSGDIATSTADITTFKILINITLSAKDAAMMMMDIKNIIWALLYPGMNTRECYYQDSRKKLWTNTTSKHWSSAVGSTLKSENECTV